MSMKKIVTIIGARPQIIKAAAISRAIRHGFQQELSEVIVHTGQHYDENMSNVFFDELGIPKPDYNLNVGSMSHGAQTAAMIAGIETILNKEQPQAIVLYGDTNSTLAGAIAASKIHVPVVHVEAGLRSFNKAMPEEINRIMCDHVSTLLFSPTASGVHNLSKEGFDLHAEPPFSIDHPKVYHCGDIMYDNSLFFSTLSDDDGVLAKFGVQPNNYILSTIHRNANTDDPVQLAGIFEAFFQLLAKRPDMTILLPLHPRTKNCIADLDASLQKRMKQEDRLKIVPPASFLEIVALEKNCLMVVTDSGGLQKEAFFFKKPCAILRPETEWVEIVENGNAAIVNADTQRIVQGVEDLLAKKDAMTYPSLYGDGKAAEFIVQEIIKHC
jgi:UDP-GlcNAc3NAcA epimerase